MPNLINSLELAVTLLLMVVTVPARLMSAHELVTTAATIAAACNSGDLTCAENSLRTRNGNVHRVTGTKVVRATLKPATVGSKLIKAVGVCQIDTSLWLSNHPAFAALNIPRGDEACHWLVDSDLVFVPVATDNKIG